MPCERVDVPAGTKVTYIDANGYVGRGTAIKTFIDEDGDRRVEIETDAGLLRPHLRRVGVERVPSMPFPFPVPQKAEPQPAFNLIDAIMEIDLDAVPVNNIERSIPRKDRAVLARKLFASIGLKGISVTTPSYSMASVVVWIPNEPHPGWVGFEKWEHKTYSDMPDEVPARMWSRRHYDAEKKVEAILLKAFPNHNDRSEYQSDYFDACWSVG